VGGEAIVDSGTPTSRTRVVGSAHIQIPIPLPEGMGTLSIPRHVSSESLALVEAIIKSYKPLLTAAPPSGDDS
jgi:hypothetical protein